MAKMVAVKEVTVGSVLSEEVLSINSKVLLGKDIVLTTRHISLLDAWDIDNVFIHVEGEDDDRPLLNTAPIVQPAEYLQFVQENDEIVKKTIQSFNIIRRGKQIPVSNLKDTADNIYSTISKRNSCVMNYVLNSDPKVTEFIPRHSVMVAYFAGIIARQMKWSMVDITGVAFAGLLHDIGNLINNKIGDPRTEVSIAETGFLLKETKGLSKEVLLGIMQHRERTNGSGFPIGTTGSKIHPYAKIIAVADFFHNLVFNGEYTNPFQRLDVLTNEMFGKFDPEVCQNLIDRVRDSLLFNKVILSSGQEAQIIFFNRGSYCLPIVRTADDQIIDLTKCGDVTISRLLHMPGAEL